MSRIGYKVVNLPEGVEVKQDGNVVTVKGPKGELTREFSDKITIKVEGNEVSFERSAEDNKTKALHGTTRSNFHNMVVGVSEGFKKELELRGVGYRAQMKGKTFVLNVGYSHPVEFEEEEEILAKPKINIVISTYYKGTALENLLKKLEEYLDSDIKDKNEINEL